MKQLLNRRTLLLLLIALVASVMLNGGLRVLNVSLSPTESVLRTAISIITVAQQGALVVLIIMSIAQASSQSGSAPTPQLALICVVYLVAGFVSVRAANATTPQMKQRGYEAFIAENQFIVDAIEQYEAEQGVPPARLALLYPQYLSEPNATLSSADADLQLDVPYSSIDAKSAEQVSYSYEIVEQADAGQPDQWELAITIQLGSFSWVKFVYNQSRSYDSDYRPMGSWGFRERLNR